MANCARCNQPLSNNAQFCSVCGAAVTAAPPSIPPTQVIVIPQPKSMLVSLLLTFFFGPLGMFYSTVSGAIIMCIVSIVGFIVTLGMAAAIIWPVSMVWGAVAVDKHNKMMVLQQRL